MFFKIILFNLLIIPLISFAQNSNIENDSLYDDDYVDTVSTLHIGFTGGGVVQGLFYKENNSNNDSINIIGSSPNTGFSLGLYLDKEINKKLWFRSGVFISISKLNLEYKYKAKQNNYTFNYSTLEIPFWLQYAFKSKKKGLSWGAGAKASMDISRSEDIDNRLFKLKSFDLSIGTGPNYRINLVTANKIDLSLTLNFGILNLMDSSSSIYNQSIEAAFRWQLQFLIGFR